MPDDDILIRWANRAWVENYIDAQTHEAVVAAALRGATIVADQKRKPKPKPNYDWTNLVAGSMVVLIMLLLHVGALVGMATSNAGDVIMAQAGFVFLDLVVFVIAVDTQRASI